MNSPQTHFSLLFAHREKTICTHCATGMNSVKCHNFRYQCEIKLKCQSFWYTHTHTYTHIHTQAILPMAYSTLFSHCCHAVLTWLPASSTSSSSSSEASQQLLHCTSCLPSSQYTYIWVYSPCPTQLKLPFFYLYGTYMHSYSIFLLFLFVYPHPVCVP